MEAGERLEQIAETQIAPDGAHLHFVTNHMLRTGEVAIGYARLLPPHFGVQSSVGMRGSVTAIPRFFEQRYLDHRPATVYFFLSARRATAHHH